MAWTAPITFVNGVALTAAQLNAMQANILETAVAKATAAGQYPVAVGANSLAMRKADATEVDAVINITSTSFTASTGPSVSIATGTSAFVSLYASISMNTNSETAYMGYTVGGASSVSALDRRTLANPRYTSQFATQASICFYQQFLTPGTNVFAAAYKVTNGAATGIFDHRALLVLPF